MQAFLIRVNWNLNSAYLSTIPILPNYVRNGTESKDVTQSMYACMYVSFCGKISCMIGSPFSLVTVEGSDGVCNVCMFVYTSIYICVYLCILYTNIFVYINFYICIYVYVYVYVYVYICVYVLCVMYMFVYLCMCGMYMYLCKYVYVYVCICMCMCIYIYMCENKLIAGKLYIIAGGGTPLIHPKVRLF